MNSERTLAWRFGRCELCGVVGEWPYAGLSDFDAQVTSNTPACPMCFNQIGMPFPEKCTDEQIAAWDAEVTAIFREHLAASSWRPVVSTTGSPTFAHHGRSHCVLCFVHLTGKRLDDAPFVLLEQYNDIEAITNVRPSPLRKPLRFGEERKVVMKAHGICEHCAKVCGWQSSTCESGRTA